MIESVTRVLGEWHALRVVLRELERAEHPDIIDGYGRTWTWKDNNLYVHCGTAAPADTIDQFGLPTQKALDNQNYKLCSACIDGRERHITPCKSEWNCEHPVCHRFHAQADYLARL